MKAGKPKQSSEIEVLTYELKKLNKSFGLHKYLLRGIVTGFGTAIGAGLVVAGVVVLFEQLTGLPVFGQLFSFLLESLQER